MQGFHTATSISGGGIDAITGTGSSGVFTGVGLHRPRGYPSADSPTAQPPLNCPRCDSTNTKFCYYNNYNLSQPRHFCKACRRYWTKGGVLRNVPVGGGCRKNKRASSSKSSKSTSSKDSKRTTASRSTSDTSTVTYVEPSNPNPNPNPNTLFADTCGAELPSLLAPNSEILQFSLPEPMNMHVLHDSKEAIDETKPDELAPPVLDQTVATDLLPAFETRPSGDGALAATGLDWCLVDPTLFDLTTGTVDSGSFWNQNHWGDAAADPALYLP